MSGLQKYTNLLHFQVRQFVKAVNGTDVLEMGHQEVAKYILANQDVVNLVVLQHGRML